MIDPVLKKFGLSEARKSVKNMNTGVYEPRTPKIYKNTPKKVQTEPRAQPQPKNQASQTDKTDNTNTNLQSNQQNANKLQRLIAYLKSHNGTICPKHVEQSYKVKFICLEEVCSDNLGCAQCFLYRHGHHEKAQINTCLRDLDQLNMLMNESYDLIISQKSIVREQFIKQIDLQISNMEQEFHQNLLFFKSKALKEIDDHLFSRYQQLEILNLLRNNRSNGTESDSDLASELLKIDIKGIQRDLNIQLKDISYQKVNYQPIIKLFEEMNGALSHFLAQFKKCFPKIYKLKLEPSSQTKFSRSSTTKLIANSKLISQFASGNQEDYPYLEKKTKNTDF